MDTICLNTFTKEERMKKEARPKTNSWKKEDAKHKDEDRKKKDVSTTDWQGGRQKYNIQKKSKISINPKKHTNKPTELQEIC